MKNKGLKKVTACVHFAQFISQTQAPQQAATEAQTIIYTLANNRNI